MTPAEQEPNPNHVGDLSDLIKLLEKNPEALKQLKERLNPEPAVATDDLPIPAVPNEISTPKPAPRPATPTRQVLPPRTTAVQAESSAASQKTTKPAKPIKSKASSSRAAVKKTPAKTNSAPPEPNESRDIVAAKRNLWERLGGGSLTIAILFHVIILILAAVWIIQVIQPEDKKVDFMPSGGGGGERGAQYNVQQKRLAQITPSTSVKRVLADGATSNFSIPGPENNFGEMSSLSSLAGGGLSGGLGGSGDGSGFGKGSGSGAGTAFGGASTAKMFGPINLFGQRGGSGLIGTFYDLKQKRDRTPSGVDANSYTSIVRNWIDGGLQESALDHYFRAPDQLSALQFMMPKMPAEEAPKAYNVQNEVQPAQWLAHYRGKVSPPKSGTYYFVGAADDVLIVRFGGKLVLDGSWEQTSQLTAGHVYHNDYGNHPKNGFIKGEAVQVTAGEWYEIDVVIGERPGGFFWTCLCIEEEGARYRKNKADMPLFPLFRLSSGKLPPSKKANLPPFATKGPIWTLQGAGTDLPLDPFN
jgi:hypothetical protein